MGDGGSQTKARGMGPQGVELVVQKNPVLNPVLEEHMGDKYSPRSAHKPADASRCSSRHILFYFSCFLLVLHVVTCALYGQWNHNARLYYYDISNFMSGNCTSSSGTTTTDVSDCDGVDLTHWDSQSEYITLNVLNSVLFVGHVLEVLFIIGCLRMEAFYLSEEAPKPHPWKLTPGVQWVNLWKLVILVG